MTHDNSEHMELVTVFESLNVVDLSIAKSLLEEANIPYFAKNEFLRNAVTYFGLTPVEIQVADNHVADALAVLADLNNPQDAENNKKGE